MISAGVAQLIGGAWPVWLGLTLFALGLAHGAGDEQDDKLLPFSLLHVVAYVTVGLAIAGLFLAAPLYGLTVFFALSAWHFARSDGQFHIASRLAIAGLAVGGSALLRPDETAQVLTFVTGDDMPSLFMRFLALVGLAGLAAATYAFVTARRGFGHAIVASLATALLHPVLAVGLIFLTAHAIPVQERQVRAYGTIAVARAVALPTAIALIGAAMLAMAVVGGLLTAQIAAALAFGMATPHMLTERLER